MAPFPAFDQAYNKGALLPKVCSDHSHGAYMTFLRAGRRALSLFPCTLCIERTMYRTLNAASDTPFVAFPRIFSTGYKKRKEKFQRGIGNLLNKLSESLVKCTIYLILILMKILDYRINKLSF